MSTSGDASRPPPPTAIVCKPCAAAPPVPPRPAPSARYDGAATRVEAATARLRAVVQAAPFDADARVNAHRVGLAATYQQAARIDYAAVAQARGEDLEAERELEKRIAILEDEGARCRDFARSVADSLQRVRAIGGGAAKSRAAALDVAAACDAIVAAQRKLVLEAESYDEALFDLEPVDVGSVAVDGDEGEVDDFVASVVQLDAKIRRVASKSEPTFRDEAAALDVLRRKRRQVCATISAAADVALKRAASSDDDAAVLERAPKLARLLALLRGPFADASVEKAAADAFNAIQTTYWNSRLPRCQQEVEASLKQSTCLELLENGARACRARCDREAQLHSTIFATEAGLAEAAADARDAALQTLANEVRDAAVSQVRRLDDFGEIGSVVAACRAHGAADATGTALEEIRLEAQRRAADLAHARVRAATSSQITDDELRRALKPKQWFAPLRDVLKALTDAKAARVDGAAFDDLARLAVSGVVAQLSEAQRRLAAFKAPPLELQLFAVAHLLVLREKVAPLGARLGPGVVAKKRPEKRAGVLGRLFGRRQASEQLDDARAIDAKKQLEDALRSACARVVALAHRALAGPYVDALRSMRDALPPGVAAADAAPAQLRACKGAPWAQPEALAGAARAAADAAPATDEALRRTCHAFLEQASTRRALLRPARQKALKTLDSYVAMCAALLPFDRVPSTEFEAFRAALADAEAAPEPDPMPSE